MAQTTRTGSFNPRNADQFPSLTSSVRDLNDLVRGNYTDSDLENNLGKLWKGVYDIVSNTTVDDDNKHKAMVAYLQDILQQGDLKKSDRATVELHERKLWSDLPQWQLFVREQFNSDVDTEEQCTHFVNFNAFLAHLLASPETPISSPLDHSLGGLWMLRESREVGSEVDTDQTRHDAADAWLSIAGDRLKELSEQEHSFEGKMGRGGGRYMDEGWTGFNERRWQLWTQGP